MLGWFIRILFVIAGFIASFFVAEDALHFEVVQLTIAVLLFTLMIAIIAFWPNIREWFKFRNKKH